MPIEVPDFDQTRFNVQETQEDLSSPANMIAYLTAQIDLCQGHIDIHARDYEAISDIINKLMDVRAGMRERRVHEHAILSDLDHRLSVAKKDQAAAEMAKGFDPDLNDPELIKLLDVLKTCPFYDRLDDYQQEDVTFMLDRYNRTKDQKPDPANVFTRGVINANDTGMGKTVETLAFLWVMRQVNPKSKIVWFTKIPLVKETAPEACNKWGFQMFPLVGTLKDRMAMVSTMHQMPFPLTLIMNYECVNNPELIKAIGPADFVVIDEVHKLRGGSNSGRPTQIWQNTFDYLHSTGAWPIMLSGSIINNHAKELWAYLHIMDPLRYKHVSDVENLLRSGIFDEKTLIKLLAPSMFRRLKSEVNIKMPERIIKHHHVELSDPTRIRVYNELVDQMSTWLDSADGTVNYSAKNVLDRLIQLRKCLIYGHTMPLTIEKVNPNTMEVERIKQTVNIGEPDKLNYAIELANDLIMEGEQVVICSANFNAPLDYIAPKLITTVGKIYGDNTKNGGAISESFKKGETRVILTNMVAGGEGFNWQQTDEQCGASHMIMLDDWYNPERVRQMWDRIWRRGANNRVIVHVLQVDDSVDTVIEEIREGKARINGKILESQALRAGDWKNLLKKALVKK